MDKSRRKDDVEPSRKKESIDNTSGSSYPTMPPQSFPGGYPRMPPPINYHYPPMMPQNNAQMPPSMYGYPPNNYGMPHYAQNQMYQQNPGMQGMQGMQYPPVVGAPPSNHQQLLWEQQKRMMEWNMSMKSGQHTIPSDMTSTSSSLPSSGANYHPSISLPSANNITTTSTSFPGITKSTLPSTKSNNMRPPMPLMGSSTGNVSIADEFLPSELYDFFMENGNLESDTMDPTFNTNFMGDDFDLLPLNNEIPNSNTPNTTVSRNMDAAKSGRKRKVDHLEGKESSKIIGRSKERNREHAKKARVKKKFFLDCLKEKIHGIEDENRLMRRLVEDRTGMTYLQFMKMEATAGKDNSVARVSQEEELFDDVLPKDNFGSASLHLLQHLQKANQNFTITNPHLPDNPIIYASQGFYDMCGYERAEVLGRNCRFLQGTLTDRKNVEDLRNCISTKSKKGVCILNYKKDGTPFWNYVFISPLTSSDGRVIMFIGVQCILSISDATSVIDAAAEIAAECVNAENPQKAADEAVKKVRLDGKGGMILDGGVFAIEGVNMLESKLDETS